MSKVQLWIGLVALWLMLGLTGAVAEQTYQVQPDSLRTALKSAAPGDTIVLAPGDYGRLWLDKSYGTDAARLTIKSADPDTPARFTAVKIKGARGITLEDMVFDYTYAPGDNKKKPRVSEITESQDITLRGVLFDGDAMRGTGNRGDGFGASFGMTVRAAHNITLEDCRFHQWYRGLVVTHSDGITLRGCEFHAMRSDGVDFAAVTDVLVEQNYFHDFQRHADSTDHPDMIQFWTNGTNKPSRNITIRDNVLNAGHGAWTQSIFMRNEMVDSRGAGAEMFYRNLTITGNVIINAHLHGITVGETDGLLIADNTLVRNRRALFTTGKAALFTPSIRVSKRARNVMITRNITPNIEGFKDQKNWRVMDNLTVHGGNREKPGHYDRIFVAALQGDPATLASFTYLPEGPAGRTSVGAPMLRIAAQDTRSVLVRAVRDSQFINRFHFDAGLTPGINADQVRWSFSDGTTATGNPVQHNFSGAGRFEITAEAPGARPARLSVTVPAPQVLRFDGNAFSSYKNGTARPVTKMPLSPLPQGGKVLMMGEGRDVVEVTRGAIGRYFNAGSLALDMRIRAADTPNPAGEILRIHKNLIVSMTAQGQIRVWLNTAETPKPVVIATGPLGLHDGAWHDISVRYDARDGRMAILVDGDERARGQARGALRPAESWGLTFGNPFGKKTFDGALASLDLRVDTASFAPD